MLFSFLLIKLYCSFICHLAILGMQSNRPGWTVPYRKAWPFPRFYWKRSVRRVTPLINMAAWIQGSSWESFPERLWRNILSNLLHPQSVVKMTFCILSRGAAPLQSLFMQPVQPLCCLSHLLQTVQHNLAVREEELQKIKGLFRTIEKPVIKAHIIFFFLEFWKIIF